MPGRDTDYQTYVIVTDEARCWGWPCSFHSLIVMRVNSAMKRVDEKRKSKRGHGVYEKEWICASVVRRLGLILEAFVTPQIVPPSERFYQNIAISEEAQRINKSLDKQKSERDALATISAHRPPVRANATAITHSDSIIQRTDLRPTNNFNRSQFTDTRAFRP